MPPIKNRGFYYIDKIAKHRYKIYIFKNKIWIKEVMVTGNGDCGL